MNRTTLLSTAAALAAVSALATACSEDDADATDAPSTSASAGATATGTTSEEALPAGVAALPANDAGAYSATLAAGRYRIPLGGTLSFDVTVPTESYAHDRGLFVATGNVVLKTEVAGADYGVPADACTRHGIVPAGPGVDDLVQALRDLPPFHVSKPRMVTLGGTQATYLEATLPASVDVTQCSGGTVRLPGTAASAVDSPAGYVGHWWVLDVNGQRVVVQHACWECTAADVDAVTSIPESIAFTPAS